MRFLDRLFNIDQRIEKAIEERSANLSNSHTWGQLLNAETEYSQGYPSTDLAISAVYACVKVISETVATLPIKLYKKQGKGKIEDENHQLQDLLCTEPNQFQTWIQFQEALMVGALMNGNGFARIYRNGRGQPISLQFLTYGECMPLHLKWQNYESLVYYVFGEMVSKDDIIHITGLGNTGVIGLSPITLASQAIDTSRQAEKTIGKFYKNGLRSNAVFTSPDIMKDEQFKRLKSQISKQFENPFFVLEGGMSATPLTLSPADAEIIATRKFQIEDIARFYRVPLHKIGDLSRSTNNNIEQQSTDFLTDCVIPWVEKIEQEFKRKLLFTKEKREYSFNLDPSYLLRGDAKSRAEYYSKRFSSSSITPNEIRVLEGDNPIDDENANKLYAQMQMIPLGSQSTQTNGEQNIQN